MGIKQLAVGTRHWRCVLVVVAIALVASGCGAPDRDGEALVGSSGTQEDAPTSGSNGPPVNSDEAVDEWATSAAVASSAGNAEETLESAFEQAEHGAVSAQDPGVAEIHAALEAGRVATCFLPNEIDNTDAVAEDLLELQYITVGEGCAGDLYYGRFDRASSRDKWLKEQQEMARPAWRVGSATGLVAVDIPAADLTRVEGSLKTLRALPFTEDDVPVAASLAEWHDRTASNRSAYGSFAADAVLFGCGSATGRWGNDSMTWTYLEVIDGLADEELAEVMQAFGATAQDAYETACNTGIQADFNDLRGKYAEVERLWASRRGALPPCLLGTCEQFK